MRKINFLFNKNLFFSFLNKTIRWGYSKIPIQWDGSFEHPKRMLKLMGKKILTILRSKILFIKTYVFQIRWKYSGVQLNICSRCNKQPTFSDKYFGKIRITHNYEWNLERTSNSSQALVLSRKSLHITPLCSLLLTLLKDKCMCLQDWVKIESHSSCRTNAILEYFCALYMKHHTVMYCPLFV